MRGVSRAFVFAVFSFCLSGTTGCGSRSSLDGEGASAPGSGGTPADAAVPENDAASGPLDCAADPVRCSAHIVLFGGFDVDQNTYLDDTWEWALGTWSRRNVNGPSARAGHAMATLDGKVVLFGGAMTSSLPTGAMVEGPTVSDTWEWDGSSWTQRVVAQQPAPRSGHAMATLNGKIYLFGGGTFGQTFAPAETWAWNGTAWTLVSSVGPSARTGHTMVTWGNRIILFGGSGSVGPLGDTWSWDGSAWTALITTGPMGYGPSARWGHASASTGARLWVFGGEGPSGAVDDMWAWDTAEWREVDPGTGAPVGRFAASMAALGSSALLFGGAQIAANADGSMYAWDGSAWSRGVGGPTPRAESAMTTQ